PSSCHRCLPSSSTTTGTRTIPENSSELTTQDTSGLALKSSWRLAGQFAAGLRPRRRRSYGCAFLLRPGQRRICLGDTSRELPRAPTSIVRSGGVESTVFKHIEGLGNALKLVRLRFTVAWVTAGAAVNAFVTRSRMSHENGIVTRGRVRIVDDPTFPRNEFFTPGTEFP